MNLENILAQALEAVASASEIAQLEEIRVNYLGKKARSPAYLKHWVKLLLKNAKKQAR